MNHFFQGRYFMVAGGFITLQIWHLVQLACLVILGFGAYKLYCRIDERVEKRREACIDVAVELQRRGLKRLPRILRCYAVGDYSGVWSEVKSFSREIMEGPDAVAKEFELVFRSMLADHLSTPDGMLLVKAQIAAVEATTASK
jgi:hypothetical protein